MAVLSTRSQRAYLITPKAIARRAKAFDCDYRVLSPDVSGSLGASATADNARCNVGGKSFPRLSARRRIPRQAFALKKYCGGTSPVSRISDNEDTPSSLRDSPSK